MKTRQSVGAFSLYADNKIYDKYVHTKSKSDRWPTRDYDNHTKNFAIWLSSPHGSLDIGSNCERALARLHAPSSDGWSLYTMEARRFPYHQ